MGDLLSARAMLGSTANQHQLAQQYDISGETLVNLLRFVAIPTMEINRPDTKELDAVWPSWKKEMDNPE